MINAIKTLINKTSELEEKFNSLSNKTNTISNSNSFVCFSKGLINLSFLDSNTMILGSFETKQNSPLYFQNQIELTIPSEQEINISLILNNIVIYKSKRILQSGFNQLTIMKSFNPLADEKVDLLLKITTENNSMVTIISDTLFVWGLSNVDAAVDYQALELNDKYLLAINTNNSLYYLTCEKEKEMSFNFEDFIYFGNSQSSSFVYDDTSDILYLFRVDTDGNLFYSDIKLNNEKFIDSDVSHVSSAYGNGKLVFCTIKNGNAYVYEFDNGIISSGEQIANINIIATKSYLSFNKFNNKFYIIISDKNENNYITENISVTETAHQHINAIYTLTYETYQEHT